MKGIFKALIVFLIAHNTIKTAYSQENKSTKERVYSFFNTNTDYQAKFQFSVGGASPLGIPAQIRDIESFKPQNMLGFEINGTKWFNENKEFGLRAGLKIEGRGMKTQARVKNYYTQIEDDTGAQTKGYFTGHVITDMNNTYLTVPILFMWNASERWNLYAGLYASLLTSKSFSGYIYDGSFREGTPIGELTTFEGTATGLYDFSNDLKPFQWGEQIGVEYKAKNNMTFAFDLTVANFQVFKSDFEAISFKMYNIFGNVSIGYSF